MLFDDIFKQQNENKENAYTLGLQCVYNKEAETTELARLRVLWLTLGRAAK